MTPDPMNPMKYAIGVCEAHPAPTSPCDQAYATLRSQQEVLDIAIGNLAERLSPALRGEVPCITGNAKCDSDSDPGPLSEIHGQFLAAGNRTRDAAARVNALLDRLTI